jgi:predicted AAA+ superfamily ATPase
MQQRLLEELASALRVVIVNGPRQSGKTTLLRQYQQARGGTYRTLDDRQAQETAHADPITFARHGDPPRLIDEVHRGGDVLVRAIKMEVDDDPAPGQFILSGSSRFLTVPTLSESLAGRAVFIDLWPLSIPERTDGPTDFINRVFADPAALPAADSPWTREAYIDVIAAGGFPEALTLTSATARKAWYDGYLTTVVNRDISDFAEIDKAYAIPRLLGLAAARSGSPLVLADIARSADLTRVTARNYLTYLDIVFLTTEVPAWSTNFTSKISKASKLYVTDSGLAAHLLQATPQALRSPGHPALGMLVETFVLTELMKLLPLADTAVSIWHFRERDGREIDFILEGPQGQIVALEVKATSSPGRDTVRHLVWLKERLGSRLTAGIVLHLGPHGSSYGDGIYALPVSTLWGHSTLP